MSDYPVANKDVVDPIALKDTIIFDNTRYATFLSGTWTADAETDILTSTADHGLTVDTPVSFSAETGVLPTGVSAEPEFYYVESVPTTKTLKLKSTRTGSALDITAAGTTGWKIRKANTTAPFIPLDFSLYSEVDIYVTLKYAPIASSGNGYVLIELIPSTVRILLNDTVVNGASSSALLYNSMTTKKYVDLPTKITIRKLADSLYHVYVAVTGLFSDAINMTTPTPHTRVLGGIVTGGNISQICVREAYLTEVKNGTRYIVVRR